MKGGRRPQAAVGNPDRHAVGPDGAGDHPGKGAIRLNGAPKVVVRITDPEMADWLNGQSNKSAAVREAIRVYLSLDAALKGLEQQIAELRREIAGVKQMVAAPADGASTAPETPAGQKAQPKPPASAAPPAIAAAIDQIIAL